MGRTAKAALDTEKLLAWMQHRKLPAAQLSRKIGAHTGYMAKVLSGQSAMSATAYKALCAELEVPEDTFILPEQPEQPELIQGELLEAAPPEQLDEICKLLVEINKQFGAIIAAKGLRE